MARCTAPVRGHSSAAAAAACPACLYRSYGRGYSSYSEPSRSYYTPSYSGSSGSSRSTGGSGRSTKPVGRELVRRFIIPQLKCSLLHRFVRHLRLGLVCLS